MESMIGKTVEILKGKRAGHRHTVKREWEAANGKSVVELDIPDAPIGHRRFIVTSVRVVDAEPAPVEPAPVDEPAPGTKLGDMTPAQRKRVTRRAAKMLQEELIRNAPALAAILADDEPAQDATETGLSEPESAPGEPAPAFCATCKRVTERTFWGVKWTEGEPEVFKDSRSHCAACGS